MRKVSFLLVGIVIALAIAATGATADSVYLEDGPSAGGISSDNVEYMGHIPVSVDGVGGRLVGRYFYTNDQHKIMIFDVEDPLNPVLTDFYPLPQEVLLGSEDIDTNGKILIVPDPGAPESGEPPGARLYVFDVSDKSDIKLLGTAPGGQHTQSCVLNCKYAWGSDGSIHDLRDPTDPKLLEEKWTNLMPAGGGHDVTEIKHGLVLTATNPIMFLDARKDPTHPKLLAASKLVENQAVIHQGAWDGGGTDRFLVMAGEDIVKPRCGELNGALMTFDASHWKKSHTFTEIDRYRMENGTYSDGKPAANVVGCSAHWLDLHPDFRNGGLVTAAFYEHGTRFVDVSPTGQLKEIGWFLPFGGSTGAAYWITDEIVYAVDYARGIDILRFNGKQ